jgi:hypothetical protein
LVVQFSSNGQALHPAAISCVIVTLCEQDGAQIVVYVTEHGAGSHSLKARNGFNSGWMGRNEVTSFLGKN